MGMFSSFKEVEEAALPPLSEPTNVEFGGFAKAYDNVTERLDDTRESVGLARIPNMFKSVVDSPAVQEPAQEAMVGAQTLLQVIGNKEAPAGYSQMYGERKPSRNLEAMTLDEVRALQKQRVGSGIPSSAVGRYQFISPTLDSLMKGLKLTGKEKFDAALQDRLAGALLERRGLSQWKAGKLTDEQFADNLAKEWASLPVVTGAKAGRSYYDGDGLNKALITPQAVLEALRKPDPATAPAEALGDEEAQPATTLLDNMPDAASAAGLAAAGMVASRDSEGNKLPAGLARVFSDSGAQFKPLVFQTVADSPDRRVAAGRVADVLEHDELLKPYPELGKIPTRITIDPAAGNTGYTDTMAGKPIWFEVEARSMEEAREILMHELNHGVQLADGRQAGGSPYRERQLLQWNAKNVSSKAKESIDTFVMGKTTMDIDGVRMQSGGLMEELYNAGLIPDVDGMDSSRKELVGLIDAELDRKDKSVKGSRPLDLINYTDPLTNETKSMRAWEALAWHDLRNGLISKDTKDALDRVVNRLYDYDEPADKSLLNRIAKLDRMLTVAAGKEGLPSSYDLYRTGLTGELESFFTGENAAKTQDELKRIIPNADSVQLEELWKVLQRLAKAAP